MRPGDVTPPRCGDVRLCCLYGAASSAARQSPLVTDTTGSAAPVPAVMLSAVVFAVALGAASAASELAADSSPLEDVLDPRLFIITNTSNNNSLQYAAAALGALVVFGLLLVVVLFAFGFFGNSAGVHRYDYYEPDSYSTYSQQTYNYPQGFQSRSLDSGEYD